MGSLRDDRTQEDTVGSPVSPPSSYTNSHPRHLRMGPLGEIVFKEVIKEK